MFGIDILTIMFVLAVFNLLAAAFFLLYVKLTQIKFNLTFFILSKALQGLSWLIRMVVYTNPDYWSIAAADFLLIVGFSMESILFVSFKGDVSKRLRVFYIGSLIVICSSILIFGPTIPAVKDLFILTGYIVYMNIISWKLIMSTDSTRFQRLIGTFYGTLPIISSIMFISITDEVTRLGEATSAVGILYYISILLMQLIGGVGYLLMVNERDESRLREVAIKDPLTGILNRRAFYDYAELLIHKSIRDKVAVALISIDIDHFKQINDTYGHLHGDHILKHLCQHLSLEMRKGDLLARFGGEEFVILLFGAGEHEVNIFVNRIHKSIHELVNDYQHEMTAFTVSMGVHCGVPDSIEDLHSMLKYSDDALYQSKNNGRDQATLYRITDGEAQFITVTRD